MTKQPQWDSGTGPGPLRNVVQTLTVWIPLLQCLLLSSATACALRFLNKIIVHFIIPKNVMNRNFQKSALRYCTFKVPGPASSSSLVNHESCPQPLWRCLRSCWWPVQEPFPLGPPLEKFPVTLASSLPQARASEGETWRVTVPASETQPSRETFENVFISGKEIQEKKQPLHSLGCFSWRWLFLQCLRRQPLPHPAPRDRLERWRRFSRET